MSALKSSGLNNSSWHVLLIMNGALCCNQSQAADGSDNQSHKSPLSVIDVT